MFRLLFLLQIYIAMGSYIGYSSFNQFQRQNSREATSCEERQTPGAICESCELLATCVKHSTGWVNIPIELCDNQKGFYCNSQLNSCSNATGPCHQFGGEGNFPCNSDGVFPDPYDCQQYHVCYAVNSQLVAATLQCKGDKAFDAATGRCTLTIQNNICQEQQFQCTNAGEAKPWPSNPNIFYVCKSALNQDERLLYPTLYRCGDGEVFDGFYCRPGDFTINPLTTTTQNPSGTTKLTNPTISPTGGPPDRCEKKGLYPDSENCRKYYYCSSSGSAIRHLDCPGGTHFNANLLSCSVGEC